MRGLRDAFGFLTVLPVSALSASSRPESLGSAGWSAGYVNGAASLGPARAWFPLVGLVLGGALAGLDAVARRGLPPAVVGALLVVALLVLTRALHAEGFVDCCDGLLGGYTKEERLRILRDTHAGSFAVIGGSALVLVKGSLLAVVPDGARVELLLLFPCLSRLSMMITIALFPYARPQGLGTLFQKNRRWWQVAVGVLTAVVAAGLLLGLGGVILLAACVAVGLGFGMWMTRLLGGMTGDTYGAVNELSEVAVLMLGVALIPNVSAVFAPPLW